jgi:hypothetical protein
VRRFTRRTIRLVGALLLLLPSVAQTQEGGPLARYRTGKPDSVAASVPVSLRDTVTSDPERKLPDLVAYLVKDTDDPFLEVKRIHDWIALNIGYDTTVPYGGTPPQQHWATVLAGRKGVCSGYSNLFAKMAEQAGFACEVAGGYARGTDYDLFTEAQTAKDNHAWNRVKIDGRWYFVDCTWDAGSVEPTGYVPAYSTVFLFPDPGMMIYSHFPADESMQLLDPPISRTAFLNLPPLKGDFFRYGLALASTVERINTVPDRFAFSLDVPDSVRIVAVLYEHGGLELKNATFVTEAGKRATVTVLFPRPGEFVVKLFVRRAGEAKKEYTWCSDFGFFASKGTADRFPTVFGAYNDRGCVLESPMTGPLKMGSRVTVKITAPGARNAGVDLNGKLVLLDRAGTSDTFQKEITVPIARQLVVAAQFEASGSFAGLVGFDVGK